MSGIRYHSVRLATIAAFQEQIERLFVTGSENDFFLARYLERRMTAFENMTDEEFDEEYNAIMEEEDQI